MPLSLEVFADNYPVVVIVDRDEEKKFIKDYLDDILRGKKRALYIHGSPGLGKTTVTKHVANQLEDSFDAEILYMNCANSTPNQTMHEIHDMICEEYDRKIPSKALVQRILNHNFKAKDFILVVILDNFDRMQHVDDLLWDINGISSKLPRLGLILISTSEMKLKNLVGNRLYDRLSPETYEFRPYDADRLYEIIKVRISEAYDRKIIEDDALYELCNFVAEHGGNVRYLFSLFLNSLDIAQDNESRKVSSKIIQKIMEKEKVAEIRNCLNEIKKKEPKKYEILKIIDRLASQGSVHTGLVIDEVKRNGLHISTRSIQYYLEDLERLGLINLKKVRKGQGYTQEIKPKISLAEL